MTQKELVVGVLRPDIELIRKNGCMLFDPAADAYFKLSPDMLAVVSFMAEPMPLSSFMKRLADNGINATEDDVISLTSFLQQNDLLIPEYGEISLKRQKSRIIKEQTFFLRFAAAYLFFKLPPWRPEKLFNKIAPYISWLASKKLLILLAIPAAVGYLLALRDFTLVKTTFMDSLSWAGLVKYFAVIVLLKIIHEAAHAIAAMRFNCRVRGIGIGFMVFYPRLYTDTTDSWKLPRRQRLLIDAAGLIIELLIGGIAALLWQYLPPGIFSSTMFYIFAVSTISTLLVNGNPCIRYDGYYILCDLINIDNLMSRSSEYIKQCWRWYLLRLGARPKHQQCWILFSFGVISFIYRIFLYTSIIMVIYAKFVKALAVVLLFLELYSILIYPCIREFQIVRKLSQKSASRAGIFLFAGIAVVLGTILFLPFNWNIYLPGETEPAQRTTLTITESGYLRSPLPTEPRKVSAGEKVFELYSPQLELAIERMQKTILFDRTLFNLQQLDEKQFADSQITIEKLRSDQLALQELLRRKEKLALHAPQSGTFLTDGEKLSANAFLQRGETAGEIVSGTITVSAYANDREIGKISVGDQAYISVMDSLPSYKAEVIQISSIAVELTNSPLLQSFGGKLPIYFNEKSNTFYSSQPLYRITLKFCEQTPLASGRKVSVKIAHSEQLYLPLYKFILSVFRKEF